MEQLWTITLCTALLGGALSFWWTSRERTAKDVLSDLSAAESGLAVPGSVLSQFDETEKRDQSACLAAAGQASVNLEPRREVEREKIIKLLPLIFAAISCLSLIALGQTRPPLLAASLAFGLALGYLAGRNMLARAKVAYRKKLEFFLPIVMERVVMAVQAGLDIIPALKAVIEIGEKADSGKLDPVSALLEKVVRLSEAGLGFEHSLKEVASRVDCIALKHAFIHLSVAQKEGGEIVGPLKELSDSTQLYYQDAIEEEIAKMPVKATMPLLCTFSGLIIVFITSPLIQVITMTAKSMPN